MVTDVEESDSTFLIFFLVTPPLVWTLTLLIQEVGRMSVCVDNNYPGGGVAEFAVLICERSQRC